jgi:hypothetical protein
MTSICINSDNLLFLLVIILIFYNSYKYNSLYSNLFNLSKEKEREKEREKEKDKEENRLSLDDEIRNRDLGVIHDITKAPERRVERNQYLTHQIQKVVNLPTRGYPDDYQMLGVLTRESDEKMLNLFGRQQYPGSDIWEYYVSDSTTNIPIKIPVVVNNNRELLEDTMINIPVFDNSKGKFKLTLYKYDTPRYLP